VTVSNPGDASAPVELFISFNGKLQQTGQATPSDRQFQSKGTANITVQGQGSAPGAGQLVVNINSSDPGVQFVQKSQQLNVAITWAVAGESPDAWPHPESVTQLRQAEILEPRGERPRA
jgi:hypothetical protein